MNWIGKLVTGMTLDAIYGSIFGTRYVFESIYDPQCDNFVNLQRTS